MAVNYNDYVRHSRAALYDDIAQPIIIVVGPRNIGKTTLWFDIAGEIFEKGNQFVFCRASREEIIDVITDFNKHFWGKYKATMDGTIHKVAKINANGIAIPDKSTNYGILGAFSTFYKWRGQISIQKLECFVFDEYNLDTFKPKHFFEKWFEFFATVLRESKVFKHMVFCANRDGEPDNDVNNAFDFNIPANCTSEYIKQTDLVYCISLGQFNLPSSNNNTLLKAIAKLNKNTNRYFNENNTMYDGIIRLINVNNIPEHEKDYIVGIRDELDEYILYWYNNQIVADYFDKKLHKGKVNIVGMTFMDSWHAKMGRTPTNDINEVLELINDHWYNETLRFADTNIKKNIMQLLLSWTNDTSIVRI